MSFWCHRLDQNTNEKNLTISALESKKWWNQQNKGTILQYYNLHMTPFQILGQKLPNFFAGVLVQTMTPKGHAFEINWTLAMPQNTFIFISKADGRGIMQVIIIIMRLCRKKKKMFLLLSSVSQSTNLTVDSRLTIWRLYTTKKCN